MKIMNLTERKEDAVSPVIGVMLMLVVTIVIAAVVAAFAGGIATDTEPSPSVVLNAEAYPASVVVQSLTGDRLETSLLDLKVYSTENGALLAKGTVPTTETTTWTRSVFSIASAPVSAVSATVSFIPGVKYVSVVGTVPFASSAPFSVLYTFKSSSEVSNLSPVRD